MSKKITHEGLYRGCDARTPSNKSWYVQLRETKLYWVSKSGKKFKKTTGRCPGEWPLHRLDLDTVKKLGT